MIKNLLDLKKFMFNSRLSADELRSLQDSKLRTLITHAYHHVPYYHALFQAAGLLPEDIRTIDDLKWIPITSKEDLKKAGLQNIISKETSLDTCCRMHTSGFSGEPFTVYLTPHEERIRRFLEFRTLLSIGFRPWDRLSVLGPEHRHRTSLHQRLGFYRSENISVFFSLGKQLQRLKKMHPSVLWAYPTPLRALLHQMGDQLGNIIHPRIVITSSEVLDAVTKERIQVIFNVQPFNFYGTTESGRIAAECPTHEGLHVNADLVILECLDGNYPAASGKLGSVVVTTLNSFTMPFIRYHLGDQCESIQKKCSCGSSFPLIGPVQGRNDDMIQLPSGRLLSSHGLQFFLRPFSWIDQFRFIQDCPNHLILQLVTKIKPANNIVKNMETNFLKYLGEPVRIDIEFVPFILGDKKFKTFVNLSCPSSSHAI